MSLNLDRSSWQRVSFGDLVANVNNYYRPEVDGVLPYVAGPHINPGEVTVAAYGSTDDDQFPPTFKRKFDGGDVLLHSRGIEKLALVDRVGVTGEKLFVLRTKDSNKLKQEFLVWLLLSPAAQAHIRDNFTGSVNKFLNWKPLAAMELLLPGLGDQERIADLLWAFEEHRRSTRMARSSVGSAADDLLALELSRRESVRRPLPALITEITVGVVVKPTQYYTDDPNGIPALRGLNIRPNGFDLAELVHFRPESAAALGKSTLRVGDVAIVRTGRPGDAAVVNEETAGFNCIDLIIARPGDGLCPEFLALYLNSTYGRSQISRLSAGTAQQHFNVGALKKLMIPNLNRHDQERMVSTVAAVARVGDVVSQEERALETLKSSLLTDIFGG